MIHLFWLFCALWAGGGNALFFRFRLRPAVAQGAISKEEADRFALGTFAWIGGPCLVFWALQMLADESLPMFSAWKTPYSGIANAFCVVVWVVAFSWIWFLGGDRKLARIYSLARYQSFVWKHPVSFRITVLLMIAGGVAGMWMQRGNR